MGKYIIMAGVCLLTLSDYAFALQIQAWGNITEEEWAVESFENDEDAHSIILFDFGESYIDRNINVVHKRHKRIKILDPEHSDYTDIRIRLHSDKKFQRIRGLKAQTLNRGPGGSVEVNEVGRREFFTEDSGDWEIRTFAFPALEAGSIVEFEYTMTYSNPLAMPGWDFQHSSPILHSEYRVMVPDFLSYRAYIYGYEPFEETDDDEAIFNRMNRNVDAAPARIENSLYRTVLKNAPAVRSEPFITSLNNYKNSVKYQLIGYQDQRGLYTSYMSTWDEIAEELMNSFRFGSAISTRGNIRRTTEELISGMVDDLAKAKAIYTFVASNIQWDNRYRVMTSDRARNILDDLSGSSADKAILLISMLRTAGLDADPVLISTRANGWPDWEYPTLNAFNHVLVLLSLNDSLYLLDPIDKLLPFGVLHPASLNGSGLLITDDGTHVLDILPSIGSSSNTVALIGLNSDGSLSTSLQINSTGYAGIIQRTLAGRADGEEEYLESNFLEYLPDSEIINSELRRLEEPDEPFTVTLELENDRYVATAGDMIYLNPFLVERITENSFRNPARNFPVEFNFGTSNRYTGIIRLPEGYEVLEIPEEKSIRFTENMGFSFQVQPFGDTIQLAMFRFNNEPVINAGDYDELRKYYASMADIYNQQIVLRRIKDTGETQK